VITEDQTAVVDFLASPATHDGASVDALTRPTVSHGAASQLDLDNYHGVQYTTAQ